MALKTSGFNIEVTHLTDLDRVAKLLALVMVAFIVGIQNRHISKLDTTYQAKKAWAQSKVCSSMG